MGIPGVDFATYIFGDNQYIFANTAMPHSALKKNLSSIAYHFVCESVVRCE
jgi:hypothetical protein